jgi:hypothetical protein
MELKPCPFCGKMPMIMGSDASCHHKDCPIRDIPIDVNKWNRRPPAPISEPAEGFEESAMDKEWVDDMMDLPKIMLIYFLDKANKKNAALRAEPVKLEDAETAFKEYNKQFCGGCSHTRKTGFVDGFNAALSQKGICPHWGNDTDGCHVVLIDRCFHPDCKEWIKELRYGKPKTPKGGKV